MCLPIDTAVYMCSESSVKLLRRKVIRPTPEEIEANSRSASARFRAAKRLSVGEA